MRSNAVGGSDTFVRDQDQFSVVCIPPKDGGQTLAGLYTQDDATKPEAASVAAALAPFIAGEEAYAPSVGEQNGFVYDSQAYLGKGILLPGDTLLIRDRHLWTDGVVLPPRGNFVMSTTGALLVATGGATVIAASATRESLIDTNYLMGEQPRRSPSVLHAMHKKFLKREVQPKDVRVYMYFTYRMGDFAHTISGEDGKRNRRIAAHMRSVYPHSVMDAGDVAYLDLQLFAGAVAKGFGFSFTPGPRLGADDVFAHSRHHDPDMRKKRNLVLVCT